LYLDKEIPVEQSGKKPKLNILVRGMNQGVIAEFGKIAKIDERSGSRDPLTTERLVEFLRSPHWTCMVAVYNKEIVGYMLYKISEKKERIFLYRMAVKPSFRRRKIGSQMLQFIKEKLWWKWPQIVLFVPEDNLIAQIFFRNAGKFIIPKNFKITVKATGEPAYLMIYDLFK
jgi:ribosomal protein S18 acetylase RimI-like enzyme